MLTISPLVLTPARVFSAINNRAAIRILFNGLFAQCRLCLAIAFLVEVLQDLRETQKLAIIPTDVPG